MKFRILRVAIALLFIASTTALFAQESNHDKPADRTPVTKMSSQRQSPKVTTEFGLGVGARYNWFKVHPISEVFTPNISMRMSYGAALQFRLNIGRSFGIQPEISYAHSRIKIEDKNNLSEPLKVKSNIVQIPLLLSFRIAMFRINFGPVFTLMDENNYTLIKIEDDNGSMQQMPMGRMFPRVTYAAGISVKFARCMMLDVRYADQFMDIKSENAYVWTLDTAKQPEAQRFRTSSRSVQVRLGYVF